jgi:hypothetical protein
MHGLLIGAAFGGHMALGTGVDLGAGRGRIGVYFITVVIVVTSSVFRLMARLPSRFKMHL